MWPSISVVIPCFNAEKYIVSTINTVLNQRWPNLEIVVVDDGSKDNSVNVVLAAFPDVLVIRQSNQGVAAARNNGIAHAKGDWIAFLDADDIWLEGKLICQWEQLQSNPDARMNYTAWMEWRSVESTPPLELITQLKTQNDNALAWDGPSGWIYSELLLDCAVWTSTVLMHRSLFSEIGNFDRTLRIGEDYDLWLRASRVTKILRVPKPLALYRIHPASITKSVPARNYQGIVVQRALDQWGLRSPDNTIANRRDVYKSLARTWANYGSACLVAGKPKEAWSSGVTSLSTYWRQTAGWKILVKSMSQLFFGLTK